MLYLKRLFFWNKTEVDAQPAQENPRTNQALSEKEDTYQAPKTKAGSRFSLGRTPDGKFFVEGHPERIEDKNPERIFRVLEILREDEKRSIQS